jgi:hypothetical protein
VCQVILGEPHREPLGNLLGKILAIRTATTGAPILDLVAIMGTIIVILTVITQTSMAAIQATGMATVMVTVTDMDTVTRINIKLQPSLVTR